MKTPKQIKLNDDVNLISFSSLKGKLLNVKSTKQVEMASGKITFYVVEHEGVEFEINENYVTQVNKNLNKTFNILNKKTMKSEKTVFENKNEDYNSMTVAELKSIATGLNISFISRITKKSIIELIQKANEVTPPSKEEVKAKKEINAAKKEASTAKVETKVAKKEVEILKKKVEEKEDAENSKKQSEFEKETRAKVVEEDAENSKKKITRTNKNREAYRTLKEMKAAITKGAYNPDTDYKALLKEAKSTASKASKDKGKGKDKATNKVADKGTQTAKVTSSPKVPMYTRWDSVAEQIKVKQDYKSIDELIEQADKIYVEKSGKGSNLKESLYVVKAALKLLVHFDVIVKIG